MQRTATSTRRAYNVREFCAEYGIGHDGAYQAIRDGKLVARKFGKRTIITAEDADRFIAALPRLELPSGPAPSEIEGKESRAPQVRAKPAPAHAGA